MHYSSLSIHTYNLSRADTYFPFPDTHTHTHTEECDQLGRFPVSTISTWKSKRYINKRVCKHRYIQYDTARHKITCDRADRMKTACFINLTRLDLCLLEFLDNVNSNDRLAWVQLELAVAVYIYSKLTVNAKSTMPALSGPLARQRSSYFSFVLWPKNLQNSNHS